MMATSVLLAALLIFVARSNKDGHGHHSNSYDSGENSCDFYEEAWEIREEGNSGKYEYYSSCDHDEHIIFEMETLTEMTQDGEETSNKIHSFSGGRWQFEDLKQGHHHHHHKKKSVMVTENFYYGTETTSYSVSSYSISSYSYIQNMYK